MPTAVAEQTAAEEYLDASIERFLATRPVLTDDMRPTWGGVGTEANIGDSRHGQF